MGKSKKGKKSKAGDADKKAALQAKKEAKAAKSARKRLEKATRNSTNAEDSLDALLDQYRQQDQEGKDVDASYTESLAGFPPARANGTLTLSEGDAKNSKKASKQQLFLFGGEYNNGAENFVLDHLLRYDLAKNKWKRCITPVKPPARCSHSCVYYNGSLYVFGGELAQADQYLHYRDLWKYDISGNNWEEIVFSRGKTAKAKGAGPVTHSVSIGTLPSARSGHACAVWKHFMIVFGGFYEASRDKPIWYNDVTVFDMQTEQWLPIPPLSKLAVQPEPRSACNYAVVGDDFIIHGGFSKLALKSINATTVDPSSSSSIPASETKVHTDAWTLHLKPLLQGKPPTWERLMSSVLRRQQKKQNLEPQLLTQQQLQNPSGRSGTASVAYKDRLLVYGGVIDTEQHHHRMDSVFFNNMFALDCNKRKWFAIRTNNKKKEASSPSQRRRSENDAATSQVEAVKHNDSDNGDGDNRLDHLFEQDNSNDDSAIQAAWDLARIQVSMPTFVNGNGDIVHEKIENYGDKDKKAESTMLPGGLEEGHEEEEEEKEEENDIDEVLEDEKQDNDGSEVDESKTEDMKPLKPLQSSSLSSKVISAPSAINLRSEINFGAEPLPRINACLVVSAHTLYVFGGLVEIGDREVTLDDFWSLDLRKPQGWQCLFPGTMQKQVWRGETDNDDDSNISESNGINATMNDNDDDFSEGYDELDENDEDVDQDDSQEARSVEKSSKKKTDLKEEISKLNSKHDLANTDRTPQPRESLADFYARTKTYWNEQAAAMSTASQTQGGTDVIEQLSKKELKRKGFGLAKERFEQLETVMERIKELDI